MNLKHFKGKINFLTKQIRFLDIEGLNPKKELSNKFFSAKIQSKQRMEKIKELPSILSVLSDIVVYVVEGSIFENKFLYQNLLEFVILSQKNIDTIFCTSLIIIQNSMSMEDSMQPLEITTKRFHSELDLKKEISKNFLNVICVSVPKVDVNVKKFDLFLDRLEELKVKIETILEQSSEFKKNHDLMATRKSW